MSVFGEHELVAVAPDGVAKRKPGRPRKNPLAPLALGVKLLEPMPDDFPAPAPKPHSATTIGVVTDLKAMFAAARWEEYGFGHRALFQDVFDVSP